MTDSAPLVKTYVLDTNILIHSPYSCFSFDEHNVVLVDVVLEELDNLKGAPGEKGANAREVIRILEGLREQGSLIQGVSIPGSTGKFYIYHSSNKCGDRANNADNTILRACQELEHDGKFGNVILVTNDINIRIKAELYDVSAEEYRTDRAAHLGEQYRGRCTAIVSAEAINAFYKDRQLDIKAIKSVDDKTDYELSVNEFVLLVDEGDEKHSALARFNGKMLVPLVYSQRNPYGIKPKNIGQKFAQEALLSSVDDAPLVILKGPAGTAKTFYSLAAGLEQTLETKLYDRILVARPNIKFDEDIGYLKGTEEEKIAPLIRPVFDNLEQLTRTDGKKDCSDSNSYAQDLFDRGVITAQALAYMRGRSITNTWIIIDEAQNMTPTQAFGIISRGGVGSKIILVGDPEQIDNPHLDARTNGLSYASERMRGSPLCWQVSFSEAECVRSALALEAIRRMPPKGLNL